MPNRRWCRGLNAARRGVSKPLQIQCLYSSATKPDEPPWEGRRFGRRVGGLKELPKRRLCGVFCHLCQAAIGGGRFRRLGNAYSRPRSSCCPRAAARLRTAEVDVVPDSVEFDTVTEHSRSAVCCMLKPAVESVPGRVECNAPLTSAKIPTGFKNSP